jgi:hypothetical protein
VDGSVSATPSGVVDGITPPTEFRRGRVMSGRPTTQDGWAGHDGQSQTCEAEPPHRPAQVVGRTADLHPDPGQVVGTDVPAAAHDVPRVAFVGRQRSWPRRMRPAALRSGYGVVVGPQGGRADFGRRRNGAVEPRPSRETAAIPLHPERGR